MQRESLNETREQSREDKGEDRERKMRPPPLRAKEKRSHCVVRLRSARLVTARLGLCRFAFPLQFSTALEWAGLFTCRYSCTASTAVTSS